MPTLTAIYRHYTGDLESHPRTIAAHFAKLEPRRQRIVRDHLKGCSFQRIADAYGISKGSAQSVVSAAMEHVRKAIAGEPRYAGPRSLQRPRKDGFPGPRKQR